MKAMVDRGACIGDGLCTTVLPEVVALKQGKSSVIVDIVLAGIEDTYREAAQGSPVRTITVLE